MGRYNTGILFFYFNSQIRPIYLRMCYFPANKLNTTSQRPRNIGRNHWVAVKKRVNGQAEKAEAEKENGALDK